MDSHFQNPRTIASTGDTWVPSANKPSPGVRDISRLKSSASVPDLQNQGQHIVREYKSPEKASTKIEKRGKAMQKMSSAFSWDLDGKGFTSVNELTGTQHRERIMDANPRRVLSRMKK